jgi:hypothetical protein
LSRSVDLDFEFAAPIEMSGLLNDLVAAGCSLSYRGQVSYVFDENKMFDWVRVDDSRIGDLLDQADALPSNRTAVGFAILLDVQSEIGGDLLFHPERSEMSFIASINRRILSGSSKFTDLGWYLGRLIPILEPLGLVGIQARDLE